MSVGTIIVVVVIIIDRGGFILCGFVEVFKVLIGVFFGELWFLFLVDSFGEMAGASWLVGFFDVFSGVAFDDGGGIFDTAA